MVTQHQTVLLIPRPALSLQQFARPVSPAPYPRVPDYPNYFACGGGDRQSCCGEPDSIPCCGHPCEPIAANQDCVEIEGACHYDVECAVGRFCSGDIDPRTCEDIPTS
jgi:hypothetical protein